MQIYTTIYKYISILTSLTSPSGEEPDVKSSLIDYANINNQNVALLISSQIAKISMIFEWF